MMCSWNLILSYSGCPGHKDIEDDAAMARHQAWAAQEAPEVQFLHLNRICKSHGNGLGEAGSNRDRARVGTQLPSAEQPAIPKLQPKKHTFVLGFVSLIQIFHVEEDLPAAKEKNNLLSLF